MLRLLHFWHPRPFVAAASTIFVLISSLALVVPAQAATFTPVCTEVSLVAAINTAGSNGAVDTITLPASCTYTLTATLTIAPDAGNLLTINGSDDTINGNGSTRVLLIQNGGNVAINHVTISGGSDTLGGGIFNGATLALTNVTISNNSALNQGGGIQNSGALTLTNSIVSGNKTTAAGSGGGGIWVSGGSLNISGSTFSNNTTVLSGGALNLNSSAATTTIINSTFTGNQATDTVGGGNGGAMLNGGPLTVTGSTFSTNSARHGGAIFNAASITATFTSSVFDSNQTDSGGQGGAIYVALGTVALDKSAVKNNMSPLGGGVWNLDTFTAINSTFYSNGISSGSGGGVMNAIGVVTLTNATLTLNTATNGAGVYNAGNGTLTLNNTILANSVTGADCLNFGTITASHSLIESGGCGVTYNTAAGNIGLVDPDIATAPTGNGYFPINSAGSFAVNGGDNSFVPAPQASQLDQAGNTRIQQGTVDMGSFESAFVPLPRVTITPASVSAAEGTSTTLTVARTGSTASALTVNFAVTGTASPSDYTLMQGVTTLTTSVTIPAGQASVDITLAAVDDVAAEPDETVIVTLASDPSYGLGSPSASTVTIPANDFVVTNTNDSGEGSLRQAVLNANAFSSNDTITFTVAGMITLTSGELPLANNGSLTIVGAPTISVSASNGSRVLNVNPGANVTINSLTITGATFPAFGGDIINQGSLELDGVTVSNGSANFGGGVYNDTGATLTLNSAIVSGSSAISTGGGIYSKGTLNFSDSTFSGNTASTGAGIMVDDGSLTMVNSTVATNHATTGFGGGIFMSGIGTVNVYDSTINKNIVDTAGRGGGVFSSTTAFTLDNSIIANSTGGDCAGNITVNYSLIQGGGCGVTYSPATGNRTGDPNLDTNTTGSPGYFRLNAPSPAINAGSVGLIPGGVTLDQAGGTRVVGSTVDMGSFESNVVNPVVSISPSTATANEGSGATLTVSRTGSTASSMTVNLAITGTASASDYTAMVGATPITTSVIIPAGQSSVDIAIAAVDDISAEPDETVIVTLLPGATYDLGAPSSQSSTVTIPANDLVVTNLNDSGEGSLRQAVLNANAFNTNDTITFTVTGTITLTSGELPIANNGSLTIVGGAGIAVSGNNASRVFNINAGATVTINSLTITAGSGGGSDGGAILNGGSLELDGSTVSFSNAPGSGGGIYSTGSMTLSSTTILNNHASGNGGGVFYSSSGTATFTGSTFSTNTAQNGGGIYNFGAGSVSLVASTLTGNSTSGGTERGGGAYNDSGGTLTLINSTVDGNTANPSDSGQGGGIYSPGTTNVFDSTITSNTADTFGGIISIGGSLNNTIVAYNVANANPHDCGFLSNLSHTLVQDGSCGASALMNGNVIGDPNLGAFTGNPGYRPLNSPSPAIDSGLDSLVPGGVTTDQAGNPRFVGTVDMGSIEAVPVTPTVTITATTATAPEGGAPGVFTFTRVGSTAAPLDVYFADGGTAIEEVDYHELPGPGANHITIPAGAASATMQIVAIDDIQTEADETVDFFIAPSGSNYIIGTPSSATVTIPANDFVVTNLNDFSGAATPGQREGTLRQAVENANNLATNDVISFTVTGTINLTGGELTLANNGSVDIDGSPAIIINAVNASRIFSVDSGANATLTSLTMTNGSAPVAGGAIVNNGTLLIADSTVSNSSSVDGGGINNVGSLEIDTSTVSGNNATGSGGGIYSSGSLSLDDVVVDTNSASLDAGGIYMGFNPLTMVKSTIRDNHANGGHGGGIYGGGSVTISASTISGNTASSTGGGIYFGGGTATLTNVTVGANSGSSGGGIANSGSTTLYDTTVSSNTASAGGIGGITNGSSLTLNNTIIANSSGGADCSGTVTADHSLVEDGTCISVGTSGNRSGDPHLSATLNGVNLGYYSILDVSSPAVDAGLDGLIPAGVTFDEPGNARIRGNHVDMGAYESPFSASPALSATKTITGPFDEGNTVTYSVVISNTGTGIQSDNPGSEFSDTLPAQLTLVSANATAGTAGTAGNTVTWNGSLAVGANTTITVTATINAGTRGQTVSNQGTVNFDANLDGTNESSALTDDPGVGGASDPTVFTVTVKPGLTINDVTLDEGNTGTTTFAFTVSLDQPAGADGVTFNIATADDTALVSDNDYVANSVIGATIPQGSTTYTFDVTVNGDSNVEPDEDFFVNVTNVSGAYLDDGQGVGTIVNDENPGPPAFVIVAGNNLQTTEAGGTATFTIALNSPPTEPVTIGLSSSDTTEGTVSPSSVTISATNWNVPQTVTITGVDDFVTDGNIAYQIITAPAVSTDPNYGGQDPVDVDVTNIDDDIPGFTIVPTSGLVTTEGGQTATFTVKLNAQPQPTTTVEVDLSSSNAAEGAIDKPSLTFDENDWMTPQTVTITGVDDNVVDGDQPYTIITAAAISGDPAYTNLDPADVSVTNLDNDTPGFVITPTSGLQTTESGGTATFTVALLTKPSNLVTLGLSSSNTAEGTIDKLSLTFDDTNWNVAQTVTITGVDDTVVDGDVLYHIVTAAAISNDQNYGGLDPADVSVTNLDNDRVGRVTVMPTSGLQTTEGGGTATFTVVLDTAPTADVSIGLSSSDTTEGVVDQPTLTFNTTNWNLPQTVTVTGVDDMLVDGDIAYTIVTAPAVSSDAAYSGIDPADVGVTNLDNDQAAILVHPDQFQASEGDTLTYQIALGSAPSSAPVTVELIFDSVQISVDGHASPVFLNFSDTTAKTVTVHVLTNETNNNQSRVTRIVHVVSASTAPEYPVNLQGSPVTINIADVPPPPPSPTCGAENFDANGVVRTGIPDAIRYAINCRILFQNGSPTTWLGNPLYSEANIGTPGMLDLGIEQAVDFFSPPGLTYFEGGAVFCLRGSGYLVWFAASHSPRHADVIGSYTVPEFPGFTCATLFEPGTLVLVQQDPIHR